MAKLSERLRALADHLLQNPYRDDWVTAGEGADLALAVEAFQAAEQAYADVQEAIIHRLRDVSEAERRQVSRTLDSAKARLLEVNLG